MKRLLLISLILSGCTINLQDAEARNVINQHAQQIETLKSLANAVGAKLQELQDKGYLKKEKNEAK